MRKLWMLLVVTLLTGCSQGFSFMERVQIKGKFYEDCVGYIVHFDPAQKLYLVQVLCLMGERSVVVPESELISAPEDPEESY